MMRKTMVCIRRLAAQLLFVLIIAAIPAHAAAQTIDLDRIAQMHKSGPWAQVSGDLVEIYDEHQAYLQMGGFATLQEAFKPTNRMVPVVDDLIVIDAIAEDDPEALLADLEALGLQNGATFGAMVSGRLPLSAIEDMAVLNSLRFVRPAYFTTNVGLTTSQGDAAMRADVARAAFGVDGNGVIVGVLSDSFDCLGGAAGDVASGDLPPGINVLDDTACPGIDEGRAMMQLVRDVAPGAGQAFHTALPGQANFANGIVELAAAGADVIVDDIIYFAEPMFQDGIIAQAVDTVEAAGVSYFSAAGNNDRQSYQAPYVAGAFHPGLSVDYGPAHDFDPGPDVDICQAVTIPQGTGFILSFQWDEPYASASGGAGSTSDIDIFLADASCTSGRAGGVANNLGSDPVEDLRYFNPFGSGETAFNIVIANFFGFDPGLMKYVIFGNLTPNEYGTASSTIYGHANAAGAEAVGAAFYVDTPEFGTDPALLEGFSSAGPTPILFDLSDNPIHDLRAKPEIVAPDNTNTTFFGVDIPDDPDTFPNFRGTSAAAPHAAAVAALLLEFDPTLTPLDIYTTLEDTALDMGPPGFDDDSGFGLIQADLALAGPPPDPEIVSPAPGSTLSGSTVTFSWVSNGTAVEFYALWFGSSQGSGDLGKPDKQPGSQLSFTKTGLPTDGRQIWVRLFWRIGGVWLSGADVQYTAAIVVELEPQIVSPEPGSTLSGSTVTFSWISNGVAAEFYALWFGSSQGSGDLGKPSKQPGSQLSFTKTGLPTDGSAVWVRLFWRIGGVWLSGADVQYTAAIGGEPEPEIVSPAPGSTLSGSTVTFSWVSNGVAVEFYALWFGSSQGSGDLGKPDKQPGSQLSFTKTGLPTDGSAVWVRLFWRIGGVWLSGADVQYTAAIGGEPEPEIVSPAPGSTLSGSTVTFSWVSNGVAVEFYALWFGSSQGSGDLGKPDKQPGSQLSFTKTGLPTDGRVIWVRLFWRIGGVWSSGADVQYTAAIAPEIVSPVPGSTLSGSTATFSWISNGVAVENYALWFGSSLGTNDLGESGTLPGSQLSYTNTNLPTDGRAIHVTFFFKLAGASGFTSTGYQFGSLTKFTGTYSVAGSVREFNCPGDPTIDETFAFTGTLSMLQATNTFQGNLEFLSLGGTPLAGTGVSIGGPLDGTVVGTGAGSGTFLIRAFVFDVLQFTISGTFSATLTGLRIAANFAGAIDGGGCSEIITFSGPRTSPSASAATAAAQTPGTVTGLTSSTVTEAQVGEFKRLFADMISPIMRP